MKYGVKIQRKYGYIPVSSRSGSMIGILMKRMLARNCQTFFQRFLRRRRIRTLACSGLSIWTMPASWSWATNRVRSSIEIVCGRYFRSKRLLDVLEGLLAVELLEEEVFLDLEPEVLERDRVLDDVVGHPLVELGLDDQVGAELDLEVLGGLPDGQRGGQGGGGTHRSAALGSYRFRGADPSKRRDPFAGFDRHRGEVGDARPSAIRAVGRRSSWRDRRRSGAEVDGHLGLQPGRSSFGMVGLGFSNSAWIRTGGLGDRLDLADRRT